MAHSRKSHGAVWRKRTGCPGGAALPKKPAPATNRERTNSPPPPPSLPTPSPSPLLPPPPTNAPCHHTSSQPVFPRRSFSAPALRAALLFVIYDALISSRGRRPGARRLRARQSLAAWAPGPRHTAAAGGRGGGARGCELHGRGRGGGVAPRPCHASNLDGHVYLQQQLLDALLVGDVERHKADHAKVIQQLHHRIIQAPGAIKQCRGVGRERACRVPPPPASNARHPRRAPKVRPCLPVQLVPHVEWIRKAILLQSLLRAAGSNPSEHTRHGQPPTPARMHAPCRCCRTSPPWSAH